MAANEVRQIRPSGRILALVDKIDRAALLESNIKSYKAEVADIKEEIREHGKENKLRVVEGRKFYAKIEDKIATVILVKPFARLLKKLGFEGRYEQCVRVQIGEAKKVVGETMLKTVAEVETEEWEGSVSIKEKKKK